MLYFIVNPKASSGKGRVIWNKVAKMLLEDKDIYIVYFTERAGHATELARRICAKADTEDCTIIAVGGDGTVNEVVDGLSNYEKIRFGYIPTGSANDTVRGLGLHAKPEKALQAILNPKEIRQVNIGKITSGNHERHFMVSAGLGYDAAVCHQAIKSRLKKKLNKIGLGKLVYFFLAVKNLVFLDTYQLSCVIDKDKKMDISECAFLVGMNLPYEGGGLKLCPNAQYSDDQLDFCLVEKMPKLKLLCILPLGFWGKHTGFHEIHIYRGQSIAISTDKKVAVHTDGENWGMRNQVKIELEKQKLPIIVR